MLSIKIRLACSHSFFSLSLFLVLSRPDGEQERREEGGNGQVTRVSSTDYVCTGIGTLSIYLFTTVTMINQSVRPLDRLDWLTAWLAGCQPARQPARHSLVASSHHLRTELVLDEGEMTPWFWLANTYASRRHLNAARPRPRPKSQPGSQPGSQPERACDSMSGEPPDRERRLRSLGVTVK